MNASQNFSGVARQAARWAVAIALVLTVWVGTTGCDEANWGIPLTVDYPINAATQNVPTWNGLANPWNTSSLGLPESPWSYWNRFFAGL